MLRVKSLIAVRNSKTLKVAKRVEGDRVCKWAKVNTNKGDKIKVVKGRSVGFCKDVRRVSLGSSKEERRFKR